MGDINKSTGINGVNESSGINDVNDIVKLIKNMPEDEQKLLLKNLSEKEGGEKKPKKVRRKHYKNKGKVVGKNTQPPSNPPAQTPQTPQTSQKMEAQKVNFKVGPRENKFETSSLFNSCKADINTDKKLWKNISPYERDRGSQNIIVNCSKCNQPKETQASLVFKMPNGEYSFTCNNCTRR